MKIGWKWSGGRVVRALVLEVRSCCGGQGSKPGKRAFRETATLPVTTLLCRRGSKEAKWALWEKIVHIVGIFTVS